MKKRIAIDMDQVLADMEVSFIELYKKEYQVTFESTEDYIAQHPDFDIVNVIKELYPLINTYDFFRKIPVMKDAQKVLRELNEHYDLYIATAAMDVPNTFKAKYEWLLEHFDFLNPQHFVFCGEKSIIHADYLIDDSIRQLDRFSGTGLLYTNSLNQDPCSYERVYNWMDIRDYFMDDQKIASLPSSSQQ
ncbi:5' nucleotidase, NT5C type [Desemzia sp. FAM 23991]|uniref:5' nucleotidase, NT5C type n=1 Tax=unclassified Desemzia TaxID=2685243 RepID=UPI003884154A